MTLLEYIISGSGFFAVSFVAAAVNSVAGGGTFLTFPVFILGGLTALQANIMSTIALWPGVLASSYGYRSIILATDKTVWRPFLIIGLIGGAAGAALLLMTPEIIFKTLVPWLLLLATLIFTFGHHGVALLKRLPSSDKSWLWAGLCFQMVIAIYGGYFGAGIGILTLAMLQIMGFTHIHQMNALKTVLTAAINAVTAMIFIFSGKVIWSLAVMMVAGAICGGYTGARMALKVSPKKVRLLVSFIGFAMSAYFFLYGVS